MNTKNNFLGAFGCTIVVALFVLGVFSLVLTAFPYAGSEDVNAFNGNPQSNNITFGFAGGTDATTVFTIDKDVPVSSATMKVSTADAGTGMYPYRPRIDFGADGDDEWRFQGPGYGYFGKQNMFKTNQTRETLSFSSGGTQSTTRVLMPADANVHSATFNITGRLNVNTPTKGSVNSQSYSQGPCVIDVDGDGDEDVVTVYSYYYGGYVYWYENTNGLGTAWTQRTVDSAYSNNRYLQDVDVDDIDGDGDMDIVVAGGQWYNSYTGIAWYQNNGGSPPTWTKRTLETSGCSDVKIADMDGDGDKDLVYTIYYYSNNGIYWRRNNGGTTPSFSGRLAIDADFSNGYQLDVADMDGDGDLDVGATSYQWGGGTAVGVFENANGLGTSWNSVVVDSALRYGWDFQFYDIDNDGDQDCAATGYYDYKVKWYENVDQTYIKGSGDGSQWNEYTIASNFNYAHGLYICDIANDGYTDIFVTGMYGRNFYWYESPDDPTTGQWTRWTVDTNLYYGWDNVVCDLNGDGTQEVVATASYGGGIHKYSLSYGYPSNPTVNFGGDGNVEWSHSGQFGGKDTSTDFASQFNTLLGGTPSSDIYGNQIVEVPVHVSMTSAGRLTLNEVEIVYDYTTTVEKNPHNTNLANELEELIPDEYPGEIDIRVAVMADTEGKMEVHDLDITYNDHPQQPTDIPDLIMDEDTVVEHLDDLRPYFTDDFDNVDDLTYSIVISDADKEHVTVTIADDYFVKVDSTIDTNWNGYVWAKVMVTDAGGPNNAEPRSLWSNDFRIRVMSVNDEPYTGFMTLPNTIMDEGETKKVVRMDSANYFEDIEHDKLYFYPVVDPEDTFDGEELVAYVDEENNLYVSALGDWYGSNVPVRVYCDDDPTFHEEGEDNPYQTVLITVNNLPDDAPVWDPIPLVEVTEDERGVDLINLRDYVSDVDTNLNKLDYTVIFNENMSGIYAYIDHRGYLQTEPGQENFDGMTTIVVRASDGKNRGEVRILIDVLPVDDAPFCQILTPQEDEKINGKYSIVGRAVDPEGLSKVEISIDGGEYVAAVGKESWGYTLNTEDFEDGETITIKAKALDLNGAWSNEWTVNVTIDHEDEDTGPDEVTEIDSDKDGVPDIEDKWPFDPKRTYDSDDDGLADEFDQYPYDPDNGQTDPLPTGGSGTTTDSNAVNPDLFAWIAVIALGLLWVVCMSLYGMKRYRAKHPKVKHKDVEELME